MSFSWFSKKTKTDDENKSSSVKYVEFNSTVENTTRNNCGDKYTEEYIKNYNIDDFEKDYKAVCDSPNMINLKLKDFSDKKNLKDGVYTILYTESKDGYFRYGYIGEIKDGDYYGIGARLCYAGSYINPYPISSGIFINGENRKGVKKINNNNKIIYTGCFKNNLYNDNNGVLKYQKYNMTIKGEFVDGKPKNCKLSVKNNNKELIIENFIVKVSKEEFVQLDKNLLQAYFVFNFDHFSNTFFENLLKYNITGKQILEMDKEEFMKLGLDCVHCVQIKTDLSKYN